MSLSLSENYLQDITHYTKIYNFSFDDYGIKVYYGDRQLLDKTPAKTNPKFYE